MKKKIIAITIFGGVISVIIYFFTQNNKVNIVALGDGLALGMTPYGIKGYSFNDYLKNEYETTHQLNSYIYEFTAAGKTVKELIYEIKDNISLTIKDKKIEIKQAINKADILTIAIGMDELATNKITNQIKNEYLHDLEELFSVIKVLNQKQVIIIGLYTWGKNDILTLEKINASIRDLALTNGFLFLDINKILMTKDYYLAKDSYYINYLGHKSIYEELKKVL